MKRSDRMLALRDVLDEGKLSPKADTLIKDMYKSIESVYAVGFKMKDIGAMGYIADLFIDVMEDGIPAAMKNAKESTNAP